MSKLIRTRVLPSASSAGVTGATCFSAYAIWLQIPAPTLVAFGVILLLITAVTGVLWFRERRKTQRVRRELHRVESEYRRFFDRVPCGLCTLNAEGYFTEVNGTLLGWLGYEREELVGVVRFRDLATAADSFLVDKAISVASRGGSPKGDFSITKKNGNEFPVLLRVMKIGDKVLYCILDNTDCKQALDRMKHLDQELEGFSYSISHDLRAPLRSIDGYSKILQEEYSDKLNDEGLRVLGVIMNNARRMGKLIDDLLEFSRLGRKEMQLSRIDMKAMAQGVMQQLMEQTRSRRIEVDVADLRPAVADADMMRLVWLNLLDNSVKFTGKKDVAVIQVRSSEIENGELCYEIRDNGVGFDMKYAPKLFGVFQRLHKIQDFSGTGVGLAIVKRIISRHGGRVWTEASPDNGAAFYFTIPVKEEHV